MLPWQNSIWQNLSQSQQNKRLPHGLLFYGPQGTGKKQLAIEFAHWLICEQPESDKACGLCKSCQLIQAESHPDLLFIEPEEEGKAIKVDQIRGLITKLSLTGHKPGYRVIVITPADSLNVNASNSLLKTLEEPPLNTLLILVSNQPSKLMATIRSRTQGIRFDLPTAEESLDWLRQKNVKQSDLLLRLAGGSPLTALSLADEDSMALRDKHFKNWQELARDDVDALEIVNLWTKEGFKINPNRPLYWIYSWIMDMARTLQGGHTSSMVNTDYAETLQKLAVQVDLKSLYGLLDRLHESLRMLDSSANQQMLLEGILLHWAGLKRLSNT